METNIANCKSCTKILLKDFSFTGNGTLVIRCGECKEDNTLKFGKKCCVWNEDKE